MSSSSQQKGHFALIFPGQGSQFPGMGRGFFDTFTTARETFEEANDLLGYDITRLCLEGPVEELNRTRNTQPALLTVSTAIYRVLAEEVSLSPRFVAGHSLGEYTALVAAGVLDFTDAVKLVALRGRFMQEAVPDGVGAMAAILGLSSDLVTELCSASSGEGSVAVPANINSPEQIVISGNREAVERASLLAKEKGAKRVVPLPVSVPSHSPLMKGAAERLSRAMEAVEFGRPGAPVITNVEAEPLTSGEEARELLVRQLYSPVRWVDSIRRMVAEGVEVIVEVGPGKVLTGLAKRIERGVKTLGVDRPEDIDFLKGLMEEEGI
ncbi:MAG: ACP S-malonyltransferase [Thermodesulfobacteriota bacterium]